MLPSWFDYTFVYLRQKARLRPELSPYFVNFRPEPDPKKLARLTSLQCRFCKIIKMVTIIKKGNYRFHRQKEIVYIMGCSINQCFTYFLYLLYL